MKFFSDCSGKCDDCYIFYSGGCVAGHGDDDFTPITPEEAITIIKRKEKYSETKEIIKKLIIKFPEIKSKLRDMSIDEILKDEVIS